MTAVLGKTASHTEAYIYHNPLQRNAYNGIYQRYDVVISVLLEVPGNQCSDVLCVIKKKGIAKGLQTEPYTYRRADVVISVLFEVQCDRKVVLIECA
jgi:hypothetical protein